jgi:hypothetical protein
VARPVLNKFHERRGPSQKFQNAAGHIDVFVFAVAGDVIDLSGPTATKNPGQGLAMVLHVDPVAHIKTTSVQRQRDSFQGVGDEQGQKFFGVLVGAVIVGAPGDHHRIAMRQPLG